VLRGEKVCSGGRQCGGASVRGEEMRAQEMGASGERRFPPRPTPVAAHARQCLDQHTGGDEVRPFSPKPLTASCGECSRPTKPC